MESELSMNALFCFVFPPERLLIVPLYFGGADGVSAKRK